MYPSSKPIEYAKTKDDCLQFCLFRAFDKSSFLKAQDTHENIKWVPMSVVEQAMDKLEQLKAE